MRQILLCFVFSNLFLHLLAQTPNPAPCGSGAEPAEDCETACISCDFNGYMGSTGGFAGGNVPSFCSQIQNDQWIGFIAGASNATFTITPSNCENGNGVQVALYGGCNEGSLACNGGGTGNGNVPTSITSPLIPGTNYYLLIDGFVGDVCDFTINVVPPTAVQANLVGAIGPIAGPAQACPGATLLYSIPNVINAGFYTWTGPAGSLINGETPPVTVDAPGGHSVQVTFGAVSGQVCVHAANTCFDGSTVCRDVVVMPIPPTNLPRAVVCAEAAPYTLSWGQQVNTSGTYAHTYSSYYGCDSVVQQPVVIKQYIVNQLPNKVVCAGTCITVCGEEFCETGSINVKCENYLGCDSTVNQQLFVLDPRAEIVASNTLLNCLHNSITLQSAFSAPSSIKRWKKLDGTLLETNVNSLTVTQPDTIILITTQSQGGVTCTQSDTVIITANYSSISATATVSDTLTCSQPIAQLSGASNVPGALFTWTGPSGFAADTDIIVVGAPGGLYSLVATHPLSRCMDTVNVEVVAVGDLPIVSAQTDTLTCNNQTIDISATTTAFSPSFAWMGPNGFTSNLPNPTIHLPGLYSVLVTDDSTGCLAFTTVTISIDTTPPSIMLTGGTLSCAQVAIHLVAVTSASMPSFSWIGPAGFSSSSSNPIVAVPGKYTVTVTNAITGCTSSAMIEVLADLQAPGAVATDGTLSCTSMTVQLQGSSPTPGAGYAWTGPGGEFFTGPNPVVSQPGIYNLVVTAANGCTSSAEALVMPPDILIIADVQITDDQNNQGAGAIDITVVGTGQYTVSWLLNGQVIATTEDISGLMAGTYQVVLTGITDSCFTSATVVIDNTVATNEPDISQWQLFPNPAHDFVEIQYSGLEFPEAQVILFDMLGRKIWTKSLTVNSNGLRLETRNFPAGPYQLTIQDVHSMIVLPLVIQH